MYGVRLCIFLIPSFWDAYKRNVTKKQIAELLDPWSGLEGMLQKAERTGFPAYGVTPVPDEFKIQTPEEIELKRKAINEFKSYIARFSALTIVGKKITPKSTKYTIKMTEEEQDFVIEAIKECLCK